MRIERPLTKILTACSSFLLTLALAELMLVGIDFRYSPLRIQDRQGASHGVWNNPNDMRILHALDDERFVFDPVLIWRPRAGSDPFNRQGFRGPILASDKKQEEYRIFAVGDSNTLGWGGPDGANWPEELQKLLQAPGDPFVVINAAAYGYSSYQGLRRFEETLSFQPDLVLISFGSNDAHPVAMTDADFVASALGPGIRLLSTLRLGQLLLSTWNGIGASTRGSRTHRVPLREYGDDLRSISRISKQRGILCVLMTRPYIGASTDPNYWKSYAPEYREKTVDVARSEHLPLIDLYSSFSEQAAYFADESHFFPEGHRIAAGIVYRKLTELLPSRMASRLPTESPDRLPDRLSLNVGESKARPFLGRGFSGDERDSLSSFVWNDGSESLLMASLDPGTGSYVLAVEAACFPPLDSVRVEVSANGLPIGKLRFGPLPERARLELPSGILHSGPNTIRFRYSEVRRPMDVDENSSDRRELALRFYLLDIVPSPKEGSANQGPAGIGLHPRHVLF